MVLDVCTQKVKRRLTSTGRTHLGSWHWQLAPEHWHSGKNKKKKDSEDFHAMKRLTDSLIRNEKVAKAVFIHNLTLLTSFQKPTTINCMWPSPDSGYLLKHLLKYWGTPRKACYYDHTTNARKTPLNLIGYSTNSAAFSLGAAVQLMNTNSIWDSKWGALSRPSHWPGDVPVALLLATSFHSLLQ